MTNEEVTVAIKYLAANWPQPMSDDQARAYGVKLVSHPFGAVMKALSDLADTEEWRPAWATIRKRLVPQATGALEGFQKALSVINIYSPDQRDQNAPDTVRAVVARLGGWRVIGQMKIEGDERKWAEKRWAEAWEEVHAEIAAGRPMAELLPQPRLGLVQGAVADALTGGVNQDESDAGRCVYGCGAPSAGTHTNLCFGSLRFGRCSGSKEARAGALGKGGE